MLCYETNLGGMYWGDSLDLIDTLADDSVDLVITSPPFALLKQKEYGNVEQVDYVDWLCEFMRKLFPKLKDTGSLVIDLGSAYNKGEPTYNLYQFRVLLKLCDEIGYKLAQPFYWHNISALPAPIEWVNRRKIRCKNAVDTIWWLSKTAYPKADVTKVLKPYSKRMKKFIKEPERVFKYKTEHPSGHNASDRWTKNNGGAIPPNLLSISNAESNSRYLRGCRLNNIKAHPARFPVAIPEFFINYLTEENDLVVDIFSGSNTTGHTAEKLNRRWISFELDLEYIASSSFRFIENMDETKAVYDKILNKEMVNL